MLGLRYSLHRLRDVLKIYWKRGYRNNRITTCNFKHLRQPMLFLSCVNANAGF